MKNLRELMLGTEWMDERILNIDGYSKSIRKWCLEHSIPLKERTKLCNLSDVALRRFFKTKRDVLRLYDFYLEHHIKHTKEELEMVFGLLNGMENVVQAQETIGFNTDSILDIITGDFVKGFDGKWYCRGGISPALMGMLGRQGQYKSTFTASLAMRICSIYQTELSIFDSEDAVIRSKDRILRLAGNHTGILSEDNIIALDAKNRYDIESIRSLIQEIGEKKKSMKSSAMFTTPFIDRRTNERIKVWRPTVIMIDSWSQISGNPEREKIDDKGFDDPATNTVALKDAALKTNLASVLSRYASEYGIEIMSTAHYDTKVSMDPYAPVIKMGLWADASSKAKNVGSKWLFLTSPLLRCQSLTKLMADDKSCKYRLGDNTLNVDLNELLLVIDRCKNNASGVTHPFILSQDSGLSTECTDYAYIRNVGKGFSMTGNNVTHQPFLMPDTTLSRNTFRGICQEKPQVVRALQIGAQLTYIQNNFNSAGWPFPIKVDAQELTNALLSDKSKMTAERILNSRGYWLPDELITKETPEYMSVIDILEFAAANGLKGVKK